VWGRRGWKTDGDVRSENNAIIKAGRHEGRMRVQAPEREKGSRRGKVRGKRSVQDALAIEVLFLRVFDEGT